MADEIEARVRQAIVETLGGIDETKVLPDAILEDLGIDSLDCIELVMGLEDEFSCEISDDEAEKLRTVGDAITLVRSKLPKAA